MVAGKIVVCTRGTNDRVDKSQAVKEAGGIGMVLINANADSRSTADFHSVPTHPREQRRRRGHQGVRRHGRRHRDDLGDATPRRCEAPTMAGFSSCGPALAGGGDLLKPDITAPGVDVIAAVAPPSNDGLDFNAYSGTSMSARTSRASRR